VAYRRLGSLAEADEAVQDSWLRVSRAGADGIENFRGWLTTIVARLCLNALQARKARPEDASGVHLPDPIVKHAGELDPEHEVLMADSVGLALQIVLDTLPPAERLAFVLHDMFDVPFDEIAPMVGRSATAARQLASRRGDACTEQPCRLQTRTSLVSEKSSMPSSRRRTEATSTRSWHCWIPRGSAAIGWRRNASCTVVRSAWSGRSGAYCAHVCAARRSQDSCARQWRRGGCRQRAAVRGEGVHSYARKDRRG
jgi:RNA polymerase sigma factor (sigma-70 family)